MDQAKAAATLLTATAATGTQTTSDVESKLGRGVIVFIDVTTAGGGGETITPAIQFKDPGSAKYVTVTAFGTQTATATYLYTLYPGGAETAAVGSHEVQALVLPKTWRVVVTHSASAAWTYTIGYSLLV